MKFPGLFCMFKRLITLTLVWAIFLQISGTTIIGILLLMPEEAEAAAKIIEPTPITTATMHTQSGTGIVFVTPDIGYKFHVFGAAPDSGKCVYRKTTDGGISWGSQVVVDSQTDCQGVSVWYDRWTPGDTGTSIHIATFDTSADEIYYNSLDTSSDTLLLVTSTSTMLNLVTTYAAGTNNVSITKATDGKLYVNIDDSSGTFIRGCSTTCSTGSNWTAVGTPPQGNANTASILMPLAGGNIMLVNRSTGGVVRSSIWNGSTWSAFTNIDVSAVVNTTYDVGMSLTLSTSTNDIYMSYIADNNDFITSDHDLRTALYNGSSWSTTTAPILTDTSGRGLHQVTMSRDASNGDIYAVYTVRTNITDANSANVYYARSTDNMTSWESEQGPVNTIPGNLYGIDTNPMFYTRLFVAWFNALALDVIGDSILPTPTDTLVNLEPTPQAVASGHTIAGAATVFVTDQIGYRFLRFGATPDSGKCVYRKTLDGGLHWSSQVVVDAQTDCSGLAVWYDKWTPGDTGSYIHIATYDIGNDDIFYNRLDTNDDSLLLTTSTTTMPATASVLAVGTNYVSITKATDGKVYVNIDDANGTFLLSCTATCDNSNNWAAVGTAPQGNADSWSIMSPLAGGNVMLINRSTTNQIRSSVWNGSIWSSFNTIDAAAVRNTTYDVGMSTTIDISTNDIYLAYATDNDNFTTTDHDIKTAKYTGGSWSAMTSIITNDPARGVLQVAIGRDQNNGDIYTAYSIRSQISSSTSSNVYYSRSTDGMSTWEAEEGPIGRVDGDYYGLDMNPMSYERLFVSWFDNVTTVRDIYGNTLADIGPDTILSSLGTQKDETLAGENNFYVGGSFVLSTLVSKNVNTIVIAESGTIQAQNNIKNVSLYYDFDTSAPYDCESESYSGGEAQFGTTVTGGFSGADGVASFSTSPVGITGTKSMCIYPVFDIQSAAQDGDTIEISVLNPETDVLISGAVEVFPATEVTIPGTTTIVDPQLTQSGFHWRLDNGSETTASSATAGVENTNLTALQVGVPRRVRLDVSNQGSTTSVPAAFRLEYGEAAPTCDDTSSWSIVGEPSSDWVMYDSSNLTDGTDTTNILVVNGGVTDLGTNFRSSNGGVRDVSNTSGTTTLDIDDFIELEYSVMASSSAVEGSTYCFRVSRNGIPLGSYLEFPRVTIAADVLVQGYGTQIATTSVLATNVYAGGGIRIIENSSTRDVTSIRLSEFGTIDGATSIKNLKLFYDLDTSGPYDCASESYNGSEDQYGSTTSNGFDGVGETATFTDIVNISTTKTLCLYVIYDVGDLAQNNQTLDIGINSGSADVTVTGVSSVGPSGLISISGETIVEGAILSQLNYHWRNDNGSQLTASSATAGVENTPITDFSQNSPIRLRFAVTNTGLASSVPARFQLEYSPKITTCNMATVWTDVDSTLDGWDMYDSSYLTNGETTTNIAVASGGVSNGVGTFISSNGGVRDTESLSATTSIPVDDYLDLEYGITSTDLTSYSTTYCFRVSSNVSSAFGSYVQYAEITTAAKRDFKIQRGSVQVSGTSATVVAGVGYTAPASTSLAFVRITNSHHTGAGNTVASTNQNSDDVTAYISNPGNIGTSFTISRPSSAINNTRVDWEIIEFIGNSGTDNEMIVRGVGTVSYTTTSLVATGTVLSNISDNSKVVVFVTGASDRNTSRNYYAGLVTSAWDTNTNSPVFTRGANGSSIADISYAVVEFVGPNWNIQRVEHTYLAAGVTETESITAVNSLARTFLHTQKRMGATTNVVHYGHQVWLSSIGAVSFQLETGASVAVGQTSVAWIIENIQGGVGAMKVQRSNGNTTGGAGPLSLSVVLSTPLAAINNTSIMANTSGAGVNTSYPRPMAGFTITSTSTYQIWRSNTGALLTYRVELVEWPVADLALRQNYYRFYVDNNLLTPTDPWPAGVIDIGENTSITTADEPLGAGEHLRIRMSLRTSNAAMPAGLQNFKLQYALRSTTCSAVSGGSWADVGPAGSGSVWRGYAATGTTDGTSLSIDPPTGGDLLISVSDRAGSLVEENPSAVNPYPVAEGDNIEYDWHLEQNGANPQSTYCFRVVRSDSTPLEGYNNYPQIRTAGFTPLSKNWRWYDDVQNETPTIPLANENVAPIDVANTDTLALRVSVKENKNAQGDNIKFKLQFSEDVTFANPIDVAATSSCQERSFWCYTEGAGIDDNYVTTQLLTDGDGCVASVGAGCGRHNTIPDSTTSHTHFGSDTQEYSFTIRHVAARVNAVYYFRLYDVTNDSPVFIAVGESYPSLVTEGPLLQLSLAGLPSGTTTAGVMTDISTTPTGISFGALALDTEYIAAHRVSVETNATEGYQVLKFARQQLMNSSGVVIPSVTSTNLIPLGWATACNASSTGCVGYHSTDPTLKDGSTRFAPSDTYAALDTTPAEVMYSSIPSSDTHDIVYRIRISELQAAGDYETEIVYLAVPSY